MFSLLTMWGLRRKLVQACRQGRVVELQFYRDDDQFVARVNEVTWFTFTFDALDLDETTWLATHTFPLQNLASINQDSTDRVRCRLEDQFNEGDAPYLRGGTAIGIGEGELDIDPDEDDDDYESV